MKKILIVRLSAIGDVVMASPLAHAFKNTNRDSHITWLVEESAAEVLRGNPHIDEVLIWPRGRWKGLLKAGRISALIKEFFSLTRELRRKPGFDLAVDIQGLLKSGIWTFLSGARQKIGLGSKEGSRILMDRVVERTGPSDRISSQYLQFADDLALVTDGFPMMVPTLPEDDQFAEDFITTNGLARGFITLCPFTTRPQKHWFDERWVLFANRIMDQRGLLSVLLGGPLDKPAAGKISGAANGTIISITGETTLKQAAAIIRRSSLLAGVDTGLTHMGFALGTPTVALFGATRPYLYTDWMPGKVLYHPHECSPCRRNPTCEGDHTCMKAISTNEVMASAKILLGPEGGSP